MRPVARALCALSLALAPVPLPAQQGDAFVLPPGMFRLRATAEFAHFDSRFAPGGGAEPLASNLLAPLTAQTFAPLLPLQTELNRFLGAGAVQADPQTLRLGALDVAADANVRVVPLSLAAGVLPRLEMEVSVPLLREEVLLTRFGLAGGTVGANPDTASNAELFGRIDPQWRTLGRSALLPTDSSALGRELQRLVAERLPGETLDLPDSAATAALLDQLLGEELGLAPLQPGIGPWRTGDAEVSARFRLLSTLGAAPVPTDSTGLHYRAALSVSARFPTGSEPDSIRVLSQLPAVGQSGFGAGVDGDVYYGTRFWATVSARYSSRSEVEVLRRVVPPTEPFASPAPAHTVRWAPADRISIRATPRFRLTESLSLGAQYSLSLLGDDRFTIADGAADASVLDVEGGAAQTLGIGFRFSTLPAYWEGRGLLPVEVSIGWETTLSGPEGLPDASVVTLQASVFQRIWGR
jgi:hypothetical protein